ncbi:flavodoxin [Saccharicrinis fermentans]|uniref:Flavodoxin n=1 Tax=Saccharicrinis fermentans DSM 9555 = JCM 21142 TaxID=869213 RepID=W7Y4K7_9BACT|nr:flavodoxin [Saccharicrinis fermentans]GAF03037.1 flavodoxin [Saccharicrinis fermentans DSM 9555 = JCM 21142]
MNKTGIFYGPEKGSVAKVANMIADELGKDTTDIIPIKNCNPTAFKDYHKLIFGISTLGRTNWDSEHKDDDWDQFFTQLKNVNWDSKQVAIYGLGDQINYPDHFVDAIGWLYERLKALNVDIVGAVDDQGYHYNESEALIKGQFMGLPLDEDNESEKSPSRIEQWTSQLKKDGF